jgi:hypothetical protein
MSDKEASRSRKQAVVVVPVYKTKLEGLEFASFVNNAQVLKSHDVVVIHPAGLDLSFYKQLDLDLKYHAFRKDDFANVRKYCSLVTHSRFYRAFSEYEYLLICHFDAWVFSDELAAWCDKGYDYIGAPFIEPFVGKLSRAFPFTSRFYVNEVGNGGFCLRKISTHIAVTKRLRWLSPLCLKFMFEDIFLTLASPLVFRNFRRPDAEEAHRFAIDKNADECMVKLEGEFPFGCHAWLKRDVDFWFKYINPESFSKK